MNRLDYPYTSVHVQPIDNLLLHSRGRLYHFERAIVELIHEPYRGEGDPKGSRWWLLCTDMASDESARCFPAREPIADWERMTDMKATPEMIGRVGVLKDGWVR